jgi:hypothetical protein
MAIRLVVRRRTDTVPRRQRKQNSKALSTTCWTGLGLPGSNQGSFAEFAPAATSLQRHLLPTSQRKYSRALNLPELPCKIVESWGPLPMRLLFAKKVKECPQCESSRVRRSCRRGFLERFLYRILFVWPYRCDACDVRFLGFRRQYAPVRIAAPERQ